jgi:hypothetical protein
MDSNSKQRLFNLLCQQRLAALGTLRQGDPHVSMVLYVTCEDFNSFYLHISRLAHHTRDILLDPRVSLMIAEDDSGNRDPQTLARVSISGEAHEVPASDQAYAEARARYLARFPQAERNFALADFSLYRITPTQARYVADFGKIFNLDSEAFARNFQ